MWQIVVEPAGLTEDVRRGLRDALTTINRQGAFFDRGRDLTLARAPGRLDLMGGIADYSGALVLQWPLAVATWVAAQVVDEPVIRICSPGAAALGDAAEVEWPLSRLLPRERALPYAEARAVLAADPRRRWAAYAAGALAVLRREEGAQFAQGIRLLIHSEVPVGKGVSSSAALEVATMQAVCDLLGRELPGRRIALLCQMVENAVVGAPCGVMDQMVSACGAQDTLLALLCQPAEIQPGVTLPGDLAIWGLDSGAPHTISGGDYGAVRVGAFMGYRMIADLAGLPVTRMEGGYTQVEDARWRGYLCNIAPSEWESRYRDHVPETIEGAAFLARYGGSTDRATTIAPERRYPVRQPTAHPIYEHHRVRLFRALLAGAPLDEEHARLLGELMYQSHVSYCACGLGAPGTDRLVALAQEAGPAAGVYGAKITGGGSGGTVAVLGRRDAQPVVAEIARRYGAEIGQEILVLGGSSPGALQFGRARARYVPGT